MARQPEPMSDCRQQRKRRERLHVVIESPLNLGAFRKLQGVFDVDTEISNGALDFRMTKQDLDGSQIARCLVNDRGFGAAERMRSVFLRLKADASDPFVDPSRAYCRVLIWPV